MEEKAVKKQGLASKLIGDKKFYKMILLIAVPIMIQNGITNFVSLLDNIMIGRIGTEQMSGAAIVNQLIFVYNLCIFGGVFRSRYFYRPVILDKKTRRESEIPSAINYGWH